MDPALLKLTVDLCPSSPPSQLPSPLCIQCHLLTSSKVSSHHGWAYLLTSGHSVQSCTDPFPRRSPVTTGLCGTLFPDNGGFRYFPRRPDGHVRFPLADRRPPGGGRGGGQVATVERRFSGTCGSTAKKGSQFCKGVQVAR